MLHPAQQCETMSAADADGATPVFARGPRYLALARLTHAGGRALCSRFMTLGGENLIMGKAGPGRVPRP